MDQGTLNDVMKALLQTLSPIESERTQAELHLSKYESTHGFAASLFQLLIAPNVDLSVRQCACIYFKHLVYRTWEIEKLPPNSPVVFSVEMKNAIKQNIVQAIVQCPPILRAQLGITLGAIIGTDFPQEWPDLLNQLVALLTSNEPNNIFGALFCLLKIAKKYEYVNPDTEKREIHNKIVEATFPILLNLFSYLSTQTSMETLKMEVLLVKIYFASVQFSMPPSLCQHEASYPWIKQLMNLLERPVPSEIDNSEKWTPWVAKRWVTGTLTRLFSRYGHKRTKGLECNIKFGELFVNSYAVPLLESFFNLLTQPISRVWPKRVTTACLNFVSNSIYPSISWKVFKIHLPTLFEQILFPTLVFSQQDAEDFEEDPEEWVREQFSFEAEMYNPSSATISLIFDTIKLRGEGNLLVFMNHVSAVLRNYQNTSEDKRNPGEKDACLHLLGSISTQLIESETFRDGLEEMVINHILPELNSPHAFLRARANWCFGHFAKLTWKNTETFLQGSEVVLRSMQDNCIAVRVFAALALKHFSRNTIVKPKLQPIVPQIIEAYLKLMSEIQSDELIAALQCIIKIFQKEIIEIAPIIFCSLAETYTSLITKYDQNPDSSEGSAAHQAIGTIVSLLDGVRTAPKIFAQMDNQIVQLLMTFNDNVIDFFTEYISIAAIVTFYGETISIPMWQVFEKLCEGVLNIGDDFLEECLGPLDNFISKGTEIFLSNPKYLQLVWKIYENALVDADGSENIAGDACQLMEIVFLYCKRFNGSIDALVPQALLLATKKLEVASSSSLQILLLGVVANGLFYNPQITLNFLVENKIHDAVFAKWFQLLDEKYKRLHDLKLSILALSALFYLPFSSWPVSLQRELKVIFITIASTIKKFDDRKLDKDAESDETSDTDDEDNENDDDEEEIDEIGETNTNDDNDIVSEEDDDDDDDDEIGEILTGSEKKALGMMKTYEDQENVDPNKVAESLLSRLDEEYEDDEDTDDFDLEDDENFETIIDDIDEIIFFLEAFQVFSKRDEAVYNQFINSMSDEEKQIIQTLSVEAESRQKAATKTTQK